MTAAAFDLAGKGIGLLFDGCHDLGGDAVPRGRLHRKAELVSLGDAPEKGAVRHVLVGALHPGAGDKDRIFGEKRRQDHALRLRKGERRQHGAQRGSGPAGEKQILRAGAAAKALV